MSKQKFTTFEKTKGKKILGFVKKKIIISFATEEKEDHLHDESASLVHRHLGGFDFGLAHRNAELMKKGMEQPKYTKTGTTIVGLVFKDGVVLGADTRATADTIVAQKNCEKIHYIAPNIYCCGAGTAADTESVTEMISSQLALMRLDTNTQSRVICALTRLKRYLFRYMGYVSAALVLGGVDCNGPHLHTVWPHGSTETLPYVTMGSGSLAAMAIFEAEFKPNMQEEEAKELVKQAILSGINNDLGSGSNVDLCVITKDKTQFLRNIFKTEIPQKKIHQIKYPHGTTVVLRREVVLHGEEDEKKEEWCEPEERVQKALERIDAD
ncbi:proteasome beta 7 subunit-like protein [Reticulomyxa filosa]|uniref:proteasome endopeptidase complex n=1 Tax=Reticulomyxa filosa TaxID=46433 RepID=X6N3Z5_RETFI|nr:proteasome beta 7 subunit-like protein [Reticulomyxa filosa]|eukprot:ETO21000.1 proteasome beta 7 subunit-like protein [Reticulomyxa filosa]